ncbi:transcriptional regulator [Natrialba sp. INN-245]|uniref:transcriptional regulator n=1 Tax=Natrialba sp. INN-245 TaxID=2690967 RepID=UPI0013119662|nr:transcriptional regulator [Natrialba sp. INN-245]MWV40942.1 transcriptional regulator [Natrialba sp. INN-245]
MRARIRWLTRVDMAILEYLDGHKLSTFEQPPSAIAANIETSSGHVRRRVRTLAAANLLERTDDTAGYYRITDLGRRYLRGELTEDERETLREFDPDDTGK